MRRKGICLFLVALFFWAEIPSAMAAEDLTAYFEAARAALETPAQQALTDGEWELPFIVRKSSCLICAPKRNPLLVPRRRRGDSNPAWELKPIEKRDLDRIEIWLDDFFRTI